MWRCPGARYILVSAGSSIFKIPRNTYFEAGSFYQYCCHPPYLNLRTINPDLEILLLDIVLLGTYIQIWYPPYLYFLKCKFNFKKTAAKADFSMSITRVYIGVSGRFSIKIKYFI